MKMGTPGPHFPGKMGTPLGKWGLPHVFGVTCTKTITGIS